MTEKMTNTDNESYLICKEILSDFIAEFDINPSYGKVEENYLKPKYYVNIEDKHGLNEIKQNIQFINVVEQHNGELCGFHALYNLYTYLNFLQSDDNSKDKLKYACSITSTNCFYKFYHRLRKTLIESNLLSNEEIINLVKYHGLEREYLNIILQQDYFDFLTKDPFDLYTIFFSMGNFTVESYFDILSLQDKLDSFKLNKNKKYLGLILGVVNHWSVLVISKESNLSYSFAYLDSILINPFELKNDTEIRQLVNEVSDKSKAKGFKELTPFFKEMFFHWNKDIKTLLILLTKVFNCGNEFKLIEYTVESNIIRFFDVLLLENLTFSTSEDFTKLYNWIIDKSHPKIVRDDTVNLINELSLSQSLNGNDCSILIKLKQNSSKINLLLPLVKSLNSQIISAKSQIPNLNNCKLELIDQLCLLIKDLCDLLK